MDLTIKELQAFKNRTLSFLQLNKECLPTLTETGSLINDTWKNTTAPLWAIFCHDILKRVRDNIFFITKSLPPQQSTAIPLQLILRGVFSDLIYLTYVVDKLGDDEAIKSFIDFNDTTAINSKKEFANCEILFYKIFEQKDLSNFFENKQNEMTSTYDEKIANYGSKEKLKKSTFSSIKEIADYFRNNQDLEKFYVLLFGPYKMLSQVEHYSFENRSYSYFGTHLLFFLERFALSYKNVIECLCDNIKTYIGTLALSNTPKTKI